MDAFGCTISFNCSVHKVISSETPQHHLKRNFQVNIFIPGQRLFFCQTLCGRDDYTAYLSSVGLCNFIISDLHVIHVCYYWVVRSQPAEVPKIIYYLEMVNIFVQSYKGSWRE